MRRYTGIFIDLLIAIIIYVVAAFDTGITLHAYLNALSAIELIPVITVSALRSIVHRAVAARCSDPVGAGTHVFSAEAIFEMIAVVTCVTAFKLVLCTCSARHRRAIGTGTDVLYAARVIESVPVVAGGTCRITIICTPVTLRRGAVVACTCIRCRKAAVP